MNIFWLKTRRYSEPALKDMSNNREIRLWKGLGIYQNYAV